MKAFATSDSPSDSEAVVAACVTEEDGVDVMKLPDMAGWWFLKMAALSEQRYEHVISRLPDEHFPLAEIRNHVIRFYPWMRVGESSTAGALRKPPSRPSGWAVPRKPRPANIAESDDQPEEGEQDEDYADEEGVDLAEDLRQVADAELQHTGSEDHQGS